MKINKIIIQAFYALRIPLLTLIILSCATSSGIFREVDSAVERGDYNWALEMIVTSQSGKKVLYNEKNAISLFLDKGILEHYAGNYAASAADLQNAERLIEEAYTKSITQNFMSYITNDNSKDYPGEDFEDIYLNVFNALNYYNMGNMEGALVEIRKLSMPSGKLDMLARRYEYTDPDTGENITARTARETGVSQMPQTTAVSFSNSALARYLGALFYQAVGNADSERIEFDQLQRAYASNKNIYRSPVPQAVAQAQNVPEEKARLNIICFTGLSPVKEEQRIFHFLPFQHPVLQIAYFKLPVLTRRPGMITRIEVIVDGQGSFDMELLEDISAVIEDTFNARFSQILIKTYIRTIIKYAVADIAAMETDKNGGGFIGFLVAAAARAAMDSSEKADIRMSRYFPDKAYIGGINLDPGTYDVYINYYHGNTIIYRDDFESVTVSEGRLNLLESINLQ